MNNKANSPHLSYCMDFSQPCLRHLQAHVSSYFDPVLVCISSVSMFLASCVLVFPVAWVSCVACVSWVSVFLVFFMFLGFLCFLAFCGSIVLLRWQRVGRAHWDAGVTCMSQ